jgi:hypothetical protein
VRGALGRVRRALVFDTFDVFRRRVGERDRAFVNGTPYEMRWATAADVAGCQERHTELDERERREGIARLAMGHSCVIARAPGGDVVFSMWMNPRNINIPGHIKRRLGPQQAFIYKAFTSPDHRGRKLYELGMRFVLAELAKEGKSELLGYAHVNKAVSRKGLAAVEFESIGRFQRVGVTGFTRVFVSSRLREVLPGALSSSGLPADRLLERSAASR